MIESSNIPEGTLPAKKPSPDTNIFLYTTNSAPSRENRLKSDSPVKNEVTAIRMTAAKKAIPRAVI